jgi:hypothetical protein
MHMIRFTLIILVFSFCLTACHPPAIKDRSTADTDFITREVTKENYCAAYIEHNRQSKLYDILDFKMDRYESNDYNEEYKSLKKRHPHNLKIYDLAGLPKEWIPLYKYKGKYYIYYPSDWGDLGRRVITDSTMELPPVQVSTLE